MYIITYLQVIIVYLSNVHTNNIYDNMNSDSSYTFKCIQAGDERDARLH